MDFDSLKAIGSNSNVKNDYTASTRKNTSEKAYTSAESKSAENVSDNKVRMTEKSADSGKYNQENLNKDENLQETVEKAISEANKILKPANKSFVYSVHDETHEIMIKIRDNATGEVLKEIPSEETLDRVAKMREMAAGDHRGFLIDEQK